MELTTAAFNTSNEYSLTLSWSSYLLIFFMTFLSVVTVLGNLVVLLSYYLDKNIRQPSNYFIFSLAISDLVSAQDERCRWLTNRNLPIQLQTFFPRASLSPCI